jgi:hypothetical protein
VGCGTEPVDLGYGECDPARVDGAVEAGITADGEFVACVVMDQPSCAEADVYDISWPVDMEDCEALSFDACDSTMWLDGECCALLEVVPAECDDEDDEVAEGRPFRVAGHARVADAVVRADWAEVLSALVVPPGPLRDAVVKAWTTAARAEHASVASCARFTLQLLHLGAPADLVADAQQAALDEVRHARLCFGVASAWSGEAVGPGPLDIRHALAAPSPREVLVDTFREGCVGETQAAMMLREAAALSADPALTALLRSIAEDEERHAALAWRTVAWLVRTWPELRPELELQVESLEVAEAGPKGPEPLGAFGVLSAAGRQRVEQRVRRGVVLPVARSLLAESTGVSPGSRAPGRDDQYCSSR